MVRIEYEAALVESVVFDEVRAREAAGDRRLSRRYFRATEALYGAATEEEREHRAQEHHARWFRELSLDAPVPAAAVEVGSGLRRADGFFVHGVHGAGEEGADLLVRPADAVDGAVRTVVVRLRPSRFRDRPSLSRFLRHELRLVADLLDPTFGLDAPRADAGAVLRTAAARDRYRLVWGTSADGRLARAGLEGWRTPEEWTSALDRSFAWTSPAARRQTFSRLWEGPRPPHRALVELATRTRDAGSGDEPGFAPGSPCPLCRFPTFEWEPDPGALPPAALARVRAAFPAWSEERGACRECADRYRLAAFPPSAAGATTP